MTLSKQTDIIRIRPTILIGLGELGGQALGRVRRRFCETFGSLREFPIVSHLWIGEDDVTSDLSEPERVSLETREAGLAPSRTEARQRFMTRLRELRNKLTEAHARIRDPQIANRMIESQILKELGILPQIEFHCPTNVYLVAASECPLASAILLDTAFLLKDLFQEGQTSCAAFLVLPGCDGQSSQDRQRANSYALLKEINHYFSGVPYYYPDWSPGGQSRIATPPFDYCYLFEGPPAEVPPGAILDVLADTIYKDFSHGEFADHKRSTRVNLNHHQSNTFDHQHPRFRQKFACRFSSLGLAKIEVPHEASSLACAHQLSAEVLRDWRTSGATPQDLMDVGRYLREEFLDPLGMVEEDKLGRRDLSNALLDTLPAGLESWSRHILTQIETGAYRSEEPGLCQYLARQARSERRNCATGNANFGSDPVGAHVKTIQTNAESLFKSKAALMESNILKLVDERGHSLAYLQASLTELCGLLGKLGESFRRKADGIEEKIRLRASEATRMQAELARSETRPNWDGRRATILDCLTRRYLDIYVGTRENPGMFLCLLLEVVYRECVGLCERWSALLMGTEVAGIRRQDGVATRIASLNEQLELLEEQLRARSLSLREVEPEPHTRMLYDSSQFESRYYSSYANGEAVVRGVSKNVLRLLGLNLTELAEGLTSERGEELRRTLVRESRQVFRRIRSDFHLLKLLYSEFKEHERAVLLKDKLALSQIWVRAASASAEGFTMTADQVAPVVGLPVASPGMSAHETAEIDTLAQRLRELIGGLSSGFHFHPIADGSELIFYQEGGGFPVNHLASLVDLRDSYLRFYTAGEPLHPRPDDEQFEELVVLGESERLALEEAHEAYVLGCLLDQVEFEGQEYFWLERVGFKVRPHPLGDRHMLTLKLSKAESLRRRLLEQVRGAIDRILATPDLATLSRYAALLGLQKRKAYGDSWGKISSPRELEFEQMMEVLVLTEQEARLMECRGVRQASPEAFARSVGQLQAKGEQFRQRRDGRLALA